jgi:hypothetical protein
MQTKIRSRECGGLLRDSSGAIRIGASHALHVGRSR